MKRLDSKRLLYLRCAGSRSAVAALVCLLSLLPFSAEAWAHAVADGNKGYIQEISGAHAKSIEMILSGAVDCAAIDSTVLEWLIAQRVDLAQDLRVVQSIGPSPIPSWVISKQLPAALRRQIRQLLLSLYSSSHGQAALADAWMDRFIGAADRDYDPIRRMARNADAVLLA